MKHLFSILIAVFIAASLFAQSPDKMSYQAVIRDADNALITNTEIGMQISILKGSPEGVVVYTETQTPTTNANGLVTIEIGGEVGFDAIDWSDDTYFIKTETDPTGGIDYTIVGTSQLLSVPYALHAKSAEAVSGELNEKDPDFNAWDKSTGVTITKSQISDLGDIGTETDPIFSAWDKSKGILITKSQITDLGNIGAETDPIFNKWDKSKGISISKSQIYDLGDLGKETDPVFRAWDRSNGITISKSQIKDLGNLVEVEVDPAFKKSVAGGITELDTNNWNHKQDKLTAGEGITITKDNTISAKGGSGLSPKHIGDYHSDGIVFYVDDSGQHGLVVSIYKMKQQMWSDKYAGIKSISDWDGSDNTQKITSYGLKTTAAADCANYGKGWYLPSRTELIQLYTNLFDVQKTIEDKDGHPIEKGYFWSSTEENEKEAWYLNFETGSASYMDKQKGMYIRPIKAF